MKQIKDVWFPDEDEHFAEQLEKNPEFEGHGTYQWNKVARAIDTAEGPRTLALDVGGHVGLWSLVLARHFDRVAAFEPVRPLAECFRKNMEEHGCTHVKLFEAAVSDVKNGAVRVRNDNPGNSGNYFVEPIDPDVENVEGAVSTLRIDDLGFEPEFVKIDVEGWELPVLRGAERTIKSCKPVVLVEQKPDNAERHGFERFAARDLLASWGARVLWDKSGDYCMGW